MLSQDVALCNKFLGHGKEIPWGSACHFLPTLTSPKSQSEQTVSSKLAVSSSDLREDFPEASPEAHKARGMEKDYSNNFQLQFVHCLFVCPCVILSLDFQSSPSKRKTNEPFCPHSTLILPSTPLLKTSAHLQSALMNYFLEMLFLVIFLLKEKKKDL